MASLGHQPTPAFVIAGANLESLPYFSIKPHLLNQGLKDVQPTHKKFRLFSDVMIEGTDIILKVKSTHWDSEKIDEYAREMVQKLFPGFNLASSSMQTTFKTTLDPLEDPFESRHSKSLIHHVVMHNVDLMVCDMPFMRGAVFKMPLHVSPDVSLADHHFGYARRPSTKFSKSSSRENLSRQESRNLSKNLSRRPSRDCYIDDSMEGGQLDLNAFFSGSCDDYTVDNDTAPDRAVCSVYWNWREVKEKDR
jgi:hypothetical protein